MELQLYLDILKRRIWVILIVVSVALCVVTAASFFIPPVYKAKATVRVLLDVGVEDFSWGENYSERLMNTYSHILKSGPTLREAIEILKPRSKNIISSELWEQVEIEVIPETELISITVRRPEPELARDFANTLAQLLVEYTQNLFVGSSKSSLMIIEEQLAGMEQQLAQDRQQLMELISGNANSTEIETLQSKIAFEEDSYDRLLDRYELARLNEALRGNSVTVISPATLPTYPDNALGLMEIGIGVVIGGAGGVGLALVLENLDTRIHSAQQLSHLTNIAILGTVPPGLLSADDFNVVELNGPHRTLAEAYRLLSVNLPAIQGIISPQTILITSAEPQTGKSRVSANLAQILADRGQTVFLLEADLRRPTLSKKLAIKDAKREGLGLSGILSGNWAINQDLIDQIAKTMPVVNLHFISSGSTTPNPTTLLASSTMETLLSYLVAEGHTVILDAPPVLGMADVSVLAPKVECVILVVRQSYSKREQVSAALEQLQASHINVLGLIFIQKGAKGWQYD